MKILPVEKIRDADAFTISNEPIASIDLMERAAHEAYLWIKERMRRKERVAVFCGTGNNGGDGLVIARYLLAEGCGVRVFIIRYSENESEDFRQNLQRLRDADCQSVTDIREGSPMPDLLEGELVIDAIFGSGLSKPVTGLAADVIRHINSSRSVVVAIDIPSGLFAGVHSDEKAGAIVQADHTLSFQFPKLAFFFRENDRFVGDWEVLPIGLHEEFIRQVQVKDHFVTHRDLEGAVLPRAKFSHKGSYGHALLVAGSYGKMGAAVLASEACLRSGVGLLHAHVAKLGYGVIQTAVPEAMVTIDPHEEYLTALPDLLPYTAIGIGPGIGFAPQTKNALKLLIQDTSVSLLLDADAITILGENKTWWSFLPRNTVLTPHPKEFERLAGKAADDFQRNRMLREFCVRFGVYVVLKGAHSCVCGPDGTCYYNSTGNPGMATAGSGDVLTGLILGLLAQNYPPLKACILGTYLHGLAGDIAARKSGMEALIAGDIVKNLGKAFKKL